jgi:hypothetical protein
MTHHFEIRVLDQHDGNIHIGVFLKGANMRAFNWILVNQKEYEHVISGAYCFDTDSDSLAKAFSSEDDELAELALLTILKQWKESIT